MHCEGSTFSGCASCELLSVAAASQNQRGGSKSSSGKCVGTPAKGSWHGHVTATGQIIIHETAPAAHACVLSGSNGVCLRAARAGDDDDHPHERADQRAVNSVLSVGGLSPRLVAAVFGGCHQHHEQAADGSAGERLKQLLKCV